MSIGTVLIDNIQYVNRDMSIGTVLIDNIQKIVFVKKRGDCGQNSVNKIFYDNDEVDMSGQMVMVTV